MYWITGILGLALVLSPFVFRYTTNTVAFWTSVVFGITVLGTSLFEGLADDKERWEYWLTGIVGLAVVLAPFLFAFTTIAQWTSVGIGLMLAVIAGSKLYYDEHTLI